MSDVIYLLRYSGQKPQYIRDGHGHFEPMVKVTDVFTPFKYYPQFQGDKFEITELTPDNEGVYLVRIMGSDKPEKLSYKDMVGYLGAIRDQLKRLYAECQKVSKVYPRVPALNLYIEVLRGNAYIEDYTCPLAAPRKNAVRHTNKPASTIVELAETMHAESLAVLSPTEAKEVASKLAE